MKTYHHKIGLLIASGFFVMSLSNCTDLDDKVISKPLDNSTSAVGATPKGDPVPALSSAYARLNDLTDQANVYAMQEHPSDEMMGPTRGTDWDDFGTWRKLHQHSWDPTHNQVIAAWDILTNGVFRATQAIYFADNNAQIRAEGSFLKAFFSYHIVDLYGQLPYANLAKPAEATILTRSQATDTLIKDLNYAIANLAPGSPTNAGKATKAAAEFLLAKVYLNKAVFKQDPTQPAGPYTFAAADMDKVIENCNAIINSGAYQLTTDYFDNFHWENSTRSKELIFVIANQSGSPVGNVQNRYRMTLHYRTNPDGWNGFTTLADFYNSFEQQDDRIGGPYPGVTDKLGLNSGFLVGQQFDSKGTPLTTRNGSPLVFTPTVNIAAAGEPQGIRVIKYLPDPANVGAPGTDYIFFRYADVLLMKAEAILRGGTDPMGATALSLVNELRANRGATALASVDAAALLAERGRELYWEGWRRNDQIRFEKFLDPVDQKPNRSPDHVVVFPLPQKSIDINPTWKQNFGY